MSAPYSHPARPTFAQRLGSHPLPETTPCAGAWYLTDLPEHHGRMTRAALYAAMLPALQLCEGCPFTGIDGPCVAKVDPRSNWSDLVAGGVIWRGGKPVMPRKQAQAAA